jgi:pectate lyase
MKQMTMIKKSFLVFILMLITMFCLAAPVSILEAEGWFESGYVTWQKTSGMKYNVYVSPVSEESWVKLDDELVREYADYGRADALGLPAGKYRFKVVPVSGSEEQSADAAISSAIDVKAHDRNGFAHKQAGATGIGAYNNDGTLKSNARVVYVWAANAKTVSLKVKKDKKGTEGTYTGLQDIIYGYQKGDADGSYDERPLCVRIIGTIRDTDMDSFGSSAEGLQIKGAKEYQPMHITIEGVGNDATIWGFGFLIRNSASVELRNFGIMLCMDDCVSIDTKNEMIWVHNLDFFYGKPGSASDQKKGDGTLDIKGNSHWCTFSYNHFYDSGKSSLGGMKSESTTDYNTYHHNWFDHSDSRHPRIRTMSMHIYNNYFDGNSKYGVGMTYGGSAFVEQNYFRHCKNPMLISKQGTDAKGSGTFSGENGGVIKSYGNIVKDASSLVTYQQNASSWDCWEASARNDQVPADVVAKAGGTGYNNFDTDASVMYDYTPDAAADVPSIVTGTYGAGRMQHGDFQWAFDNATQDTNDAIIPELKSALQDYQTMWIGFFTGATAIRELQRTPSDNQSFFDLQGRQVKRPVNHQVVVHNGHKYVSQ